MRTQAYRYAALQYQVPGTRRASTMTKRTMAVTRNNKGEHGFARTNLIPIRVMIGSILAVGVIMHLFIHNSILLPEYTEHVIEDRLVVDETATTRTRTRTRSMPQKVLALPMEWEEHLGGEWKHFLIEGIEQSPKLQRTMDVNDADAVWAVDMARFKCSTELIPLIKKRWKHMDTKTGWDIFVLNWGDFENETSKECFAMIRQLFGSKILIHYWTRSSIIHRNMVHDPKESENVTFHEYGQYLNFSKELGATATGMPELYKGGHDRHLFHGVVHTLRYGVRTDIVEHIHREVNQKHSLGGTSDEQMDLVVDLPRPQDAAHFWPVNADLDNYGTHRSNISKALVDFGALAHNVNVTLTIRAVGIRKRRGRNSVHNAYIKKLVRTKIIIVSQRDAWQGHYRLMEGLASGALVMTDPMFPLPFHISNGKHVVVYDSIGSLKRLLTFYLEHDEERLKIARAGHRVAMSEHRSWNLMERIILGDPMEAFGAKQ
uniref:Spore protein YkvP/CgeB glycosyl transferase-like domain-containing protein n=1 Tax=Attheya septentrionalis TaxID=420275 RepID=A0A7S2UR01_9STRA|mmetsp:Transcript_7119/g.12785  ORF Transcript_7119/g.12785 Transcript_7119/m.12785 type:complete len:488 (+) Transcript_7119:31-1494(+)